MTRANTIQEVKDCINDSMERLSDIHRLPADGLTIDAAALIHKQSLASLNRLGKFMRSMEEIATDF